MTKRILIVDDEDEIREMLRDFFELEMFNVVEAKNGKDALELVKSQPFDCVVSDVRMPGGGGAELAQGILNLNCKRPPIIFMTGYSDITESTALSLGVVKVIEKPFIPEELIKTVKAAIKNDGNSHT